MTDLRRKHEIFKELGLDSHQWEVCSLVYDAVAADNERLQNKLNQDSQNFEIECHKATIELLRRGLAEARWLLNHAVTRDTVEEWTRRRDAFLAGEGP